MRFEETKRCGCWRCEGGVRRGFTLIELLVVVAVLALLMAILLPSLSQARARGKTASCLANLRSLGQGFSLYRTENQNRSFAKVYSATDFWFPTLEQYMSSKNPVRICAEAPIPNPVPSGGWGTRSRAWGEYSWSGWPPFSGGRYGSYGINGYLYHRDTTVSSYSRGWDLGAATLESNIPVIGEGGWVDGWPRHTDDPPPRSVVWGNDDIKILPGAQQKDMMRYCMARHGKGAGFVFLDGHAEVVPLEGLWKLQWAPQFVPSDPPSPVPNR